MSWPDACNAICDNARPPAQPADPFVPRSRSCPRRRFLRVIPTATCNRSGSKTPAARLRNPIRCRRCSRRWTRVPPVHPRLQALRLRRVALRRLRPAVPNSTRRCCKRCSLCRRMPRVAPMVRTARPARPARRVRRPAVRTILRKPSRAAAIITITAAVAGSNPCCRCWIPQAAAPPPRPRRTATAPRPPRSISPTARASR